MSEILVATVYLENLAARMGEISSDLSSYTSIGEYGIPCSPDVVRAYDRLGDRWNVRRKTLIESLDALSDGFRTAAQSFADADASLAASLQAGSSASSGD